MFCILIVVAVSQMQEFAQIHRTGHPTGVNFCVCKLYANNPDLIKKNIEG